jgi:hypothetical protein
VIGGNLDENDPDAIRVFDPHLDQAPGLHRGLSENSNSCRSKPLMLCVNIPYLEPDHDRVPRRAAPAAGDLEQSRAQEEHHPWICRRAELPVDRQAQYVAVETTASVQVGGAQQDPAAQNVHRTILAAPLAKLHGDENVTPHGS